ncbi:lysylphosphatidylglycerol synthase transmembrane domain-containing protein [Novosphingopyxis sp.]|uniref:lysylphosphatidylglycerol synthase transmembrane domain-containing protein n=1 Tax=Novosphingopyxis sp. TaxID=2709690 RepID=UPI003B5BC23D
MKRLAALAVSLAVLAFIWWRVDLAAIAAAARAADPGWLIAGLALVVPLTLITAWRFRLLARGAIGGGEAVRLILSASTLNLVLPSKLGDIAKAWALGRRHDVGGERALSIVVFEKLLDLASLLFWAVPALLWVGGRQPLYRLAALAVAGLLALLVLLLAPGGIGVRALGLIARFAPGAIGARAASFGEEWGGAVRWFWAQRRSAGIVAVSLGLWLLHLVQFWLFARALGPAIPLLDNVAFATLAILAGLVPLTMAGIGTRDAAIVFFYGPFLGAGAAAVLGVLATCRYLIPALCGLPFLSDYWRRARSVEAGG